MTESDETVVVVDDEPELLDVICQVLDEEGFRVVCVERANRAIEMDTTLHARLYLLDLMLPGMNGIELAQELRNSRDGDASIIAMSASQDMLNKARQSGLFDDILPKPFDLTELLSRVGSHAA